MLKFSLTVNNQEQDGFKLSVQSDGEKEMEVVKLLTEQLIAKITKIEVSVTNYE
jgi:hypothetical protein